MKILLKNKTKILTGIILLLSFFVWITSVYSNSCKYDDKNDIWTNLDECLENSTLISWKNTKIEWWFKETLNSLTKTIWSILWIFAVWSIVYWALLMTISMWDEEGTNKAKNIIKWWIVWFIGVISASGVILLVVNVMFSIWGGI